MQLAIGNRQRSRFELCQLSIAYCRFKNFHRIKHFILTVYKQIKWHILFPINRLWIDYCFLLAGGIVLWNMPRHYRYFPGNTKKTGSNAATFYGTFSSKKINPASGNGLFSFGRTSCKSMWMQKRPYYFPFCRNIIFPSTS